MGMREFVQQHFKDSIEVKNRIYQDADLMGLVEEASKLCLETIEAGNKIIIAGNGGSAADAQHIAAEFVARFYFDRPAIAAIALTTDTSVLTAVANDYDYDYVFARQIEAMGAQGDVFIAISTSGNSANIIKAVEAAKNKKMKVIGLSGAAGGKLAGLSELALKIPSDDTPRIQESHILIGHIICAAVEEFKFGSSK